MMPAEGVLSFGPFQLDPARRRLTRDGEPIALPDRHVDILLLLASNAGRIVSKDALIEAGWKDVAVSDNSIEQAISGLRKTLGSQQDGTPYIETLARRGYRLASVSMYGVPSCWLPRVLRRPEMACSMLLSLTATSFHPASIRASFETMRPAFEASSRRMST